ncbi:MAG: hypothetical protein D8M52_06200 [Chlorobi bacterium]|nr:hypothetical protein [Chlorobiota bacterium]MBZ0195484.1 hypothetical protein [Candidatus Kapabacteria bacterium]MCC6332007.1 hypothetical protein [Ignavibacteria bacterium]MBV6463893.1 hypothetical protein [Chlorobiota bacterium]MCL4276816.1 hypothetical protein [Ignavibacteria bacterium]
MNVPGKNIVLWVLIITGLLITSVRNSAQTTAEALMKALEAKIAKVKTYTVNLQLDINIPFVEAPPTKATLYFKAPDKTHIETKGFAMLPKQGPDLSVFRILTQPYAIVDVGTTKLNGKTLRQIKVIPTTDASPIAVATFYTDVATALPTRVEAVTRNGGTLTAEFKFTNTKASAYALPSYAKLMFEVPPMDLPRMMSGDLDKPKTNTNGKPVKASVEIHYTDYKINVPIKDDVFR